MLHTPGLSIAHSRAQDYSSAALSSRFRERLRQADSDDGGRSRVKIRFRVRDTFVRHSAPTQAPEPTTTAPAVAEPQALFASSTSVKLKFSDRTVVRQDEDSGSTTVVQQDRLDIRLRSSQFAFDNGDVQGIAEALEGQTDVLERLFDAAGLLSDFSSQLSSEFLARIRSGLEGLAGEDELQAQATILDLKIRVESKTVRVENAEGDLVVERSVQRIDIRVRFVSLSVSGEVGEAREPVEADLKGRRGQLRGLGPLKQFDFDGDGRISFEDIVALADEVIDVDAD